MVTRELHKNLEIKDATGETEIFTSLESVGKFLKQQKEDWVSKMEEIGAEGANSDSLLWNTCRGFENAFKDFMLWKSDATFDRLDYEQLPSKLKQLFANRQLLFSHNPIVEPYRACYRNYGSSVANRFIENEIEYLEASNNSKAHSLDFLGDILWYEYKHPELPRVKASEAEQLSHKELRSQQSEVFDKLMAKQTEILKEFAKQRDQKEKEFKDLRKKYEERLRFEGPALYWEESAKKYKSEGKKARVWLVSFGGLGVVLGLLGFLFNKWLVSATNDSSWDLGSLRVTLIFVSMLTIYTFLMRLLSRWTFSCFHLQRDAEERNQLSHFYLSLNNEMSMDLESRQLILQALFSRSQTGLLSKEQGHTLPKASSLVSKVATED